MMNNAPLHITHPDATTCATCGGYGEGYANELLLSWNGQYDCFDCWTPSCFSCGGPITNFHDWDDAPWWSVSDNCNDCDNND